MLWQYILSYGGETAYSSVFGTTIQDSGTASKSGTSFGTGLSKADYLKKIKSPSTEQYKKILAAASRSSKSFGIDLSKDPKAKANASALKKRMIDSIKK